MARALIAAVVFVLAGCASFPVAQVDASPCIGNEGSYACQVKRYHDVPN